MPTLNDILWLRIERILVERGWKLADLRRAVQADNRHDNTWYNWKKGKTIMKINDLEKIARALGVSAATLLTPLEEDQPESQLLLPFDFGSLNH